MMAMAVAEIGSLSERRIAALIDTTISLLPPFLIRNPGLNSGFMIPQCTAAALMSENKQMSHPASVDSAPTSANQEDHVSMATHGARRLGPMNANLARIIAIELMAAAEGMDFRRPLLSSAIIEESHALVRGQVRAPRGGPRIRHRYGGRRPLVEEGRFVPLCRSFSAASAAARVQPTRSTSHDGSHLLVRRAFALGLSGLLPRGRHCTQAWTGTALAAPAPAAPAGRDRRHQAARSLARPRRVVPAGHS